MAKRRLNPDELGAEAKELTDFLKSRILFQNRAIESVVKAIIHGKSPLRRNDKRPIASFLFLGPSGVGKTELARTLAEYLFGDRRGFVLVNGSEFSERHTVSTLIGSPKGYIGYDEEPLLSQENIDAAAIKQGIKIAENDSRIKDLNAKIADLKKKWRMLAESSDGAKYQVAEIRKEISELEDKRGVLMSLIIQETNGPLMSIILFDEMEKAHPKVWNLLLQILDEGIIDLRNGERTYFNNSIIIMTSNIGAQEMAKFARGVTRIGFSNNDTTDENEIYEVAVEKAKKILPPELIGRITRIEVFRPLGKNELRSIVKHHLDRLIESVANSEFPIQIVVNEFVREFILEESRDHPEEGARLIEKKIKHHIINPINNLISSGQVQPGDRVFIDVKRVKKYKFLVFFKRDTDLGPNSPDDIKKFVEKVNGKVRKEAKR